jgi:hypothetical protein
MRTVLMRPDHSDRLRNYASKGSEVRALLPDSTDLSGSRSLREIADDWSRPGSVRPGSVYFIQSGNSGPVKIGFAADPESRMRGLQTGHPEKLRILAVLRNVSQRMEKNLHSRFGHLRMHGEWFRPESDLMTYIGELKAAPAVCCGSPKTCDHVWCPACHGWARDTGGFLGDGHETAYWSCGHVQPLHSRSLPPSEVTEA